MAAPGPNYHPAGGKSVCGGKNGTRPAFSAENQPDPELKSAGYSARAQMRKVLEEHRMDVARKLITLATTAVNETVQLNACNSIIDRLDGKAVQAIVTQKDPFGGWSAEQLETAAEWLEHNGSGSGIETTGEPSASGEPA